MNLKPGLYDKNDNLIYNWNELINRKMIQLSSSDETSIYYFEYGKEDQKLIMPEGITNIEYDFIGDSLGTLYIPSSVETIEMGSDGMGYIKEIIVHPNNKEYSSQDGVLFNKDKTTLVRYPSLKEEKFYKIPETVTMLDINSFANNKNIEEIEFTPNITTIEEFSFYNCHKLKEAILNEGLEYIGESVFDGCEHLTNIHLPSTLTELALNAFDYAVNIEKITIADDNPVYDSRKNCNGIIETAINKLLIGCKNTKIPDGIKIIGSESLDLIENEISIPKSVCQIETGVFCRLRTYEIKYRGTPKDLEKIENWELLKDEIRANGIEITFAKTLDELIAAGYNLHKANKILKEQEER